MKDNLENWQRIQSQASAAGARLIAVSKTQPDVHILELYEAGQRDFGENKVQELTDKFQRLPKDIRWHQIGHLQTNKVKYIAPFVHLIHAVDSFRLLQEIDKQARNNQRVLPCLLQFKIAREDSKYGFSLDDAISMLGSDAFQQLQHIALHGVMGMATFTDDEALVRAEFDNLRQIFLHLKRDFFSDSDTFREISMGMSDDYPIALESGSTMIRIGSLLFGKRNYD